MSSPSDGKTQIGSASSAHDSTRASGPDSLRGVYWLQGVTLLWMVAECALSLYAAAAARSPALLAFGSDSLVELLSAAAVLLQYLPRHPLSERAAGRLAAALLAALSLAVCATALVSLRMGFHPGTSRLGMAVALAALIAMPVLARLKRREARRRGNAALAADAVQSATCAYLALMTLAGLALHAALGIAWFDSFAALAAVPLLWKEARAAWRGHACGCCSCK